MKKRLITLSVFMQAIFFLQAQQQSEVPDLSQGDYVITNLQEDTLKERVRASLTLRKLIDGSIIVRLKRNQKSIDAYRKAGKSAIADKIENDSRKQNQKIYSAFINNFRFCKVYFIYANETQAFLDNNQQIFLNQNLLHDSTIVFTDTNFVFCEYGSVESFSKFKDYTHPAPNTGGAYLNQRVRGDKIFDTIPTQTSTSPTSVNGLFFSDKNLSQFHRPFPFVEDVYLDYYDRTVRTLNRELERAYSRLVVNKDFRDMRRVERQKQKQTLKQQK